MSPITLVLSLFLVFVQGLESGFPLGDASLKTQHEGLVNDMKGWLVDKMKDFQSDVDGHVENLKTVLETSPKEGEQRIHNMYEKSVQKLRQVNAPQVCLKNAELQLLAGKASNLQSFLTCSNFTTAGKDVFFIVLEAGKLTTKLLLSADNLLNGLSDCWSWNPITFVGCTVKWVKNVFQDIFGTYGALQDFTKNVAALVNDIKAQVDFCVHSGGDQLHEDMLNSLVDVHECSIKMKMNQ